MRRRFWQLGTVFLWILICVFVLTSSSGAKQNQNAQNTLARKKSESNLYIIQLADSPLATYNGNIRGFSATRAKAKGKKQLNVRSDSCRAYRKYLSEKKEGFLNRAKRKLDQSIEPIYTYDVVYNGISARLTPQEAKEIAELPEVLSIELDTPRQLLTTVSPEFVNAPEIWEGTANSNFPAEKGEGIIIGVIDSGVWPEHPSFADDGTYPAPPLKWGGKCTPPADGTKTYQCNNKLIGIQYFLKGYVAILDDGYDGLFYSGRDDNGHGTHVASTAAGNENISVSLYGIDRGMISGMAPRAHIASYKAIGPIGGTGADTLAAIDKAVSDGVDVINYSIGTDSNSNPWTNAEAQAFLAAREAGVFVAVSAGNGGPSTGLMTHPATVPWVTSVAANYSNRLYLSELTVSNDESAVFQGYGTSPTRGISDFNLIDAEGIADSEGDRSGNCLHPFPTGTFRSTDAVLCRQGEIIGHIKGNFVQDGGAGAVILYNDEETYDLKTYLHPIPALFVSYDTGTQLKELAKKNSNSLTVSFTPGEPVLDSDSRIPSGTVTGFSSRGPSTYSWIDLNRLEIVNENIHVIKPDISAPGIHILAGASPEYVSNADGLIGRFGHQNEFFQIVQGTSMSCPHMSGLAALVKALHPDWTPSEIQSALITTAIYENQHARTADGDHDANPFDFGGGRVDVSQAICAGFVLDETSENFKASNPGNGGDPGSLNLPGLVHANCLGECSWSRTLRTTLDIPVNWTVSIDNQGASNGFLTVEPMNFVLEPGKTQTLHVKAQVSQFPSKEWIFTNIQLIPSEVNQDKTLPEIPVSHFPVAIRPIAGISPESSVDIKTRRNQGTYQLEGLKAIDTNHLVAQVYMGSPEIIESSVSQDTKNESPYDDLDDGVLIHFFEVPANAKRFLVEITDSTASDIDLYIGIDDNGNGQADTDEERCQSTTSLWKESCSFPDANKPLESGNYWILIHNWEGSGNPQDSVSLAITLIDAESHADNMTVDISVPEMIERNQPFDMEISWDIPEFDVGDKKNGWIEIGTDISHPANIAALPLNISRIENDVTLHLLNIGESEVVYPGDVLSYLIRIVPDTVQADSLVYTLSNTIPEGMSYVPGSASIEPTSIKKNHLSWTVEAGYHYKMTSNQEDSLCKTPAGGYINLKDRGILPQPDIQGDHQIFKFNDFLSSGTNVKPVRFFREDYPEGLYFTDDGLVLLSSETGSSPWINRLIPNTSLPNNLIAPFWRDMEIVYDSAENRGVSIAEDSGMMIIEYDGIEPAPAGSTDERFDVEMLMRRTVSSTNGNYEIIFAYQNVKEDRIYPATIGIENQDGTRGVQYAHNKAKIKNDLVICFDYVNDNYIKIEYQLKVDDMIIPPSQGFVQPMILSNALEHQVSENDPMLTQEVSVTVMEKPLFSVETGEINQDIPDDDAAGEVFPLQVERMLSIHDLNVLLNISHPQVEDLRAYLISPSGTQVTLFENISGSRENFTHTRLDDEAEDLIYGGQAPFTGNFRPAMSLKAFDGESTEGEWKLHIYDDKTWDEGLLISWGLEFEFTSPLPIANDDTATTGWDESLTIQVLKNDEDPDGDTLRITEVSTPDFGSVTHDGSSVTYTPKGEFIGEDSFTYTVTDDSDGMAEAEVFVNVLDAGVTITLTSKQDKIDSDGKITLREAVLSANTGIAMDSGLETGFRDTISLPSGVYSLGKEGVLEITQSMNIIGDPQGQTIIETNGEDRAFYVKEGASVKIENITIRSKQESRLKKSARIVGGDEVKAGDYPWMAALVLRSLDAYQGQFCGGTLIHPEWVLTSAHCVEDKTTQEIDIVLGVKNIVTDEGERIEADEIIMHPEFNSATLDSDIALLHLSTPSEKVYIDLISPGDPENIAAPGTSATVIGWGRTAYNDSTYPQALLQVSIPIVSNETARKSYEAISSRTITDNMLAAGYADGGKDACRGDSGGPLMVLADSFFWTSEPSWIQAGIVSWGEGCAYPGYYGIYTRLSQFSDWVWEVIEEWPPSSSSIGGAILNEGTLTLHQVALTGHISGSGGAIYNIGTLTLLNSTLSANSAVLGGGLYNEGTAQIVFSTIAKNKATRGGGIFSSDINSITLLKNSLIADNTATFFIGADIRGNINSQGFNLIRTSLGGGGYKNSDLLDISPLIVPLMDNRGSSPTHAIQANGPAVNATDCRDLEGVIVSVDQRGVARQDLCDIGAFEYDGADYPPVAVDDFVSTNERVVSIDVLANDCDANGDPLTIANIVDPEFGTLMPEMSSESEIYLDYYPHSDFVGTDYFSYTISDGSNLSQAQVTIQVNADLLPMAQDDEISTLKNQSVEIDVLANDSDPEGTELSILELTQPSNGEVSTDGKKITYTPDPDFLGVDQFMYQVTDSLKTDKAIVLVSVEENQPETYHSADYNPQDYEISLGELIRVIQIYSTGAYDCGDPQIEDGYDLNTENPNISCTPHDLDYNPHDWKITLHELLRIIQFYNSFGYHEDAASQEDGFAPGKGIAHSE